MIHYSEVFGEESGGKASTSDDRILEATFFIF